MRLIFTLLLTIVTAGAHAQAILNEIYSFPGSNRHEFFEFFNNNTTPLSMDQYTIVTYFEEGATKGFTVVDLPALYVPPRGWFVGSAAVPFNYQGITGSTASQYSWNDHPFMDTMNAYVKRWVVGTGNLADGNPAYDEIAVPADFNDVFARVGGNGASYVVLIFRDGKLFEVFLGGTGGNTALPAFVVSMPDLFVDMSGTAPDFTIHFPDHAAFPTEYVIEDIGSDNGYIRLADGYCGVWTKSSSQVTHTPDVTNGGTPPTTSDIKVQSAIAPGSAAAGSTVTYDVVNAPGTEFPVTLNVFVDIGTVKGVLDAGDSLVATQIETSVSGPGFSTVYKPYNAGILIQAVSPYGCIDNVRFLPYTGVLPLKLTSFAGAAGAEEAVLTWVVAGNGDAGQFEVERSTDGIAFTTAAIIFPTVQGGEEVYRYKEATRGAKTFYRVKLADKSGKITYSRTIAVGVAVSAAGNLTLNRNPVDLGLPFTFRSTETTGATVNIYNTSGTRVLTQKISLVRGANVVSLSLDGRFYTGTYVLEVASPYERSMVKFIKQ